MGAGLQSHHNRWPGRTLTALLVTFLAFRAGQGVQAHPADMFLHTNTLTLTPEGIRLEWSLYPGVLLTQSVWHAADLNGDERIDPDEAALWIKPGADEFLIAVDGIPLEWQVDSIDWPASITDLELGDKTILIDLSAGWPPGGSEQRQVELNNRFAEQVSINWYYVASGEGITFQTPIQEGGRLSLDLTFEGGPSTDAAQLTAWDSGTPSLSSSESSNTPVPPQSRPAAVLAGLVRSPDLSLAFMATALAISLFLGALHALTPGHGKALVAAYLVGARGTTGHAAVLGGIVTLTHTGTVLALGGLTLILSHFIVPTAFFPLLEVASGLLIVGLGFTLLLRRWQGFSGVMRYRARQEPTAEPRKDSGERRTIAVGQEIETRSYDNLLPVGSIDLAQGITWRSLVTLGVSGGLVPCPDAIAILLVAIAINRIPLGLVLIVAFSLGLAVVLVVIGIAMVHSRHLLDRIRLFDRVAPALPVVSAAVVLALGTALTVSAARKIDLGEAFIIGGLAQPGAASVQSPADSFDIETASVLYHASDESGVNQLFVLPLAGGEPQQLTFEPYGIWDYALAPDASVVAYSAPRQDSSGQLWMVDVDGSDRRLLLDCGEALCNGETWSPDGQRLVFDRLESPDASPAGLTTLWWVEPATGEAAPVFQDGGFPGFSARWSPDGEWLSYISPGITSAVQLYNLEDGRTLSLPSQTGLPVSWSPAGEALLLTDIEVEGARPLAHLLRYDLADERLVDLTGDEGLADSWATWSPDGEWIATVRRDLRYGGVARGDSIWLMRPDGADAHPITQDPDMLHGMPVWSPDGRYLLFQRYLLSEPLSYPSIWMLEVESGDLRKVVESGYLPGWLP
jgi:ABC-type nickel/cobalt efflux system permease component RcnA/Tol biopolymer transport system component